MNEENVAIRDAKKLGLPKFILLGLQHMFAMFGATILVPILVNGYFHGEGLSIQVTLFFAGVGTLFFHICSKMKVPAFLGSSFAFLGGFATVAELDTGIFATMTYGEKLPYACGGIVVAGLLYLVLALIVKVVGVKRVMRFLPPVVTGPIIICIGLSLAPSAVGNASTNWFLAFLALGVIIVFNIWGKGMFKIIPILMGVVISYIAALIMHLSGMTNPDGSAILNFAGAAKAAYIGLPPFIFAKFNISAILVMAPIAIATMMEHIGDISAISATVGENFIENPGLHRTLIGDGLATSLSAIFGGPANTTYGENTGVLELSHVYDPAVIRLAAAFAIALSFIPKVAEIIGSLPASIVGGISFMLYGMISAIGVRNVVENKVDFTQSRNLIIAAVILVCGLGFSSGLTFTVGTTSITLTGLAIAAIAGVALNAILPGNDFVFGEEEIKMKNVYVMDHPLIKHKISILRDKSTGTNEFRALVEEIATLMGFEALKDLPMHEIEVDTPIETCMSPVLSGRKLAVVPILRAGLGMVNGILALTPTAKVGHIGMYRDEETHEPHPYYCKLPSPIEERLIVVTDPMLATGGSAVDAIDQIKKAGGKHIKFLCIIAAPEGLKKLNEAHPDVEIYVGNIDRQLNEDAYICPGLGDAGDRIFGTK